MSIPMLLLVALASPNAQEKQQVNGAKGGANVTVLVASPELDDVMIELGEKDFDVHYGAPSRTHSIRKNSVRLVATQDDMTVQQDLKLQDNTSCVVVLWLDQSRLEATVLNAHWVPDQAHVKVFNAAADLTGTDLSVDGKKSDRPVMRVGEITDMALPAGSHLVEFQAAGKSLLSRKLDLKADFCYQLVAIGRKSGSPELELVVIQQPRPAVHN